MSTRAKRRHRCDSTRIDGLSNGWAALAMVAAVSLAASVVGFGNDFAQDDLHLSTRTFAFTHLGIW